MNIRINKRIVAIGAALLFVTLISCGVDQSDEEELTEAENLIEGLMMMGRMTDIGAYSGPGLLGPPFGWEGPDTFDIPEGTNTVYYKYFQKYPLDSTGIVIDSVLFLLMFTPDIWDSLYYDSTITQIDAWLLAEVRDIWFHSIGSIPDTLHVAGEMKWSWEDTWYEYVYDVSTIDESAEIDITTSPNIRLSAQFRFGSDGAGSTEDNWGKFQETIFVRYEFFAEPDPNGYDGYYILLSEAWKIRHYFILEEGEA